MHEGPKAGGSMEFKETENKLAGLSPVQRIEIEKAGQTMGPCGPDEGVWCPNSGWNSLKSFNQQITSSPVYFTKTILTTMQRTDR